MNNINQIYSTNNFLINYKTQYYNNNNIIIELYRKYLYEKLKKYLDKIREKHLKKKLNKNPNININDKHIYISQILSYDLLSIIIMNMDNKKDPLFNDISPFDKEKLNEYFNSNKCLRTIDSNIIKSIIKIYPKLSNKYIHYYNKLCNIKINNIYELYNINYKYNMNNVVITFKLNENNLPNIKYDNKLSFPIHVFNHLVKNYNIKNFNKFDDNDIIINDNIILNIYILFTRYLTLSNGNNQASILPSFKKIIKEKLNIKIELFGSPLNTSNSTFGSYFYDTDHFFGSIGNFFNMDIIKGYYEINPPFDTCMINNIFSNCLRFLNKANDNKLPLLFLFIIPHTYFQNNGLNPSYFQKYLNYNKILSKDKFPYIRYNRNYKKTIVKPIVSTVILICNTEYVSEYVKYNIISFDKFINNWIK